MIESDFFDAILPFSLHVCGVCGTTYAGVKNFEKHCRKHESSKPHSCDKCNKSYAVSEDLDAHRLRKHSKRFKCDLCENYYSSKGNLQRHRDTHAREKTCIRHKSRNYTRSPEIVHRVYKGEKRFGCQICPATFMTEHSLKKHILGHGKMTVGDHRCVSCGKCFAAPGTLKSHITIVHTPR